MTTPTSTPTLPPELPGASPTPDPARNERRARPRRSAAMARAAWMSARARNAARRGVLIATVGGAAVIATLLVLVLLPREVDRAIRAQLDALPAPRDSMPLVALLDSARASQSRADAALRARRAAAAAALAAIAAARTPDSLTLPGASPRDTLRVELQQRLLRARSAPLAESYRALADARLLRDDARVRAIVDSIDQVDREREAYAALGGIDARYASLTARLAALGQRIIRLAETELAEQAAPATGANAQAPAPAPAPPPAAAPTAAPTAPVQPPVAGDSTRPDSAGAAEQGTPLLSRPAPVPESVLLATATAAADTVALRERALDALRRENAVLAQRRAAVESRDSISVPPLAMLAAALIVGLALGYASAVVIELRRPTVGDEGEVERLAQARVITHTGAPAVLRDARTRRRADRALPPALDPTADAWQQLHLTLTGLGDVVRVVRIVADQPLLGGTLAINLAAAAARESRATLLVEPPTRTPVLAMLLRQPRARGLSDVQQGRAELRETITEVQMGRDVSVDVVFAGAPVTDRTASQGEEGGDEELRRLASRYDLTLVVGESAPGSALVTHDLIICGRLGVTSLSWLSRVVQQAKGGQYRLRAVLLWATDVPVA